MQDATALEPSNDRGTTLIEVIVAALLLAMAAGAVSTILVSAVKSSENSRQRVAASNLAQREIENSRNLFGTSDTAALTLGNSGTQVNPTPYPVGSSGDSVVDGTKFHVVRDAKWLPFGNGTSACDGSSLVNYPNLRINVTVSWSRGTSGTSSVTDTTLLTPQKTLLATSADSYVAVKVINSAGQPMPGVNVALSGPTASSPSQTDDSGCAVFLAGSTGTYSASLNNSGYVDNTGNPTPSKSQQVATGQLYVLQFSYDRAATLRIVQTVLTGYSPSYALPGVVNYGNSALPGTTHSLAVTSGGVYTTVTNLWPSTDGYTAWAGGCADSDPGNTGAGRGAPTVVAPGGSGDVAAWLAPVDITVSSKATSVVQPNVAVTATSSSTCPAGQGTIALGRTDPTGHLKSSLPFGSWVLTVPSGYLPVTILPNSTTTATTARVRTLP
jgi:hypothetical protein